MSAAKTSASRRARPRVALVVKRTSYRKFVMEVHDPRVEKLLRRGDATVRSIRSSHEAHEETVREVEAALAELGAEIVSRGGPRSRISPRVDLVVTVGGDGTLLSASHQLGRDCPLLGVNSAPDSSVGFFCGAAKGNVRSTLERALRSELPTVELARMRVDLNGKKIHGRVLNEALFCHASPAATSRYILRLHAPVKRVRSGRTHETSGEEDQRSSGIWVGPAAGSTAAQRSAGGKVLPLSSQRLQYVVREPYTPAGGHFRFAKGLVHEDGGLELRSKMREAKVFLDGHQLVHDVGIGDVLEMHRCDEPLTVLGIVGKRRT